jgi:D-cysteine desulfhydrase
MSALFLNHLLHYHPPHWVLNGNAGGITMHKIPTFRIPLGRFPTPVQSLQIPGLEESGIETSIKRDDLTSFDLSGNKVRKLEFLMADALHNHHDCVITVGGVQSNHCRATAVAARQLGLQPHLILRKGQGQNNDEDLGLTGNLLFDRMVGSKIHTVSLSTYGQYGSEKLCQILQEQLKEEGHNPYVVPIGGSNALGAFGYIECIREIMETNEIDNTDYDHIVFACGSGGTVAGLAIGKKLSGMKGQLHCVTVCDSPEYFYKHIEEVATELGMDLATHGPVTNWCNIYDGKGIGYAKSTKEELEYLIEFSEKTGILLDPVYSGKAMFHFVKTVLTENPTLFQKGQKLLFIHTGGTLGFYDKEKELLPLLAPKNQISKLNVVKPK